MLIKRNNFSVRPYYYLALASEILRPLLQMAGRALSRGPSTSKNEWQQVLVLGNDHMGDVLYLTASLDIIKRHFPEWHLVVATSDTGENILANNPAVHDTIAACGWREKLKAIREYARRTQTHFDAALCTNAVRYWPDLITALLLGIPNRAAYRHKGFSGLVTHPVDFVQYAALPVLFRQYTNQLCIHADNSPIRPKVFPAKSNTDRAQKVMSALAAKQKNIVALFVTDRQGNARWPLAYYREMILKIKSMHDIEFVVIGLPSEKKDIEPVKKALHDCCLFAEETLTPMDLAVFLKLCKLVITKDSGPRHLANAVKTPVVFFRSLAHRQTEAAIYCDTEVDICPDGELQTPSQQKKVLEQIEVSKLVNAILPFLKN